MSCGRDFIISHVCDCWFNNLLVQSLICHAEFMSYSMCSVVVLEIYETHFF